MKNKNFAGIFTAFYLLLASSCDYLNLQQQEVIVDTSLSEVAQMLSSLPLGLDQINEVYDAVCASSENGYDEEYTMKNVFANPGAGVGDEYDSGGKASGGRTYSEPLRDLISQYYSSQTKGTSDGVPGLSSSSCQIFWPYHDNWDGKTLPIITFDPGTEQSLNEGFEFVENGEGARSVQKVMVDEATAMRRPVWVVNTNDDAGYKSLEILRRQDPDWAVGGNVIVKAPTKANSGNDDISTLILKDFTMNRQFDPWFRGASEFFVKVGSVDGFSAKTEEDMRLYQPSVTDFMIVIKRGQKGKSVPFNAILVSDWTDQMESVAFLITEDDGGTITTWKANAVVKVKSKSYGVELEIPVNDKDDIVWRGSLASDFIEKYSGSVQHFGDVDLTFDFI